MKSGYPILSASSRDTACGAKHWRVRMWSDGLIGLYRNERGGFVHKVNISVVILVIIDAEMR